MSVNEAREAFNEGLLALEKYRNAVREKGQELTKNLSLVFRAVIEGNEEITLSIASHSRYQIFVDGVFYAYGTPWSGKTDESVNVGVPIAGICFLSRGENKIKRIPGIKALKPFMDQTVRPYDKELMKNMLDTLNLILTDIPIYELSCDMSEDAVMTAYNGMQN
mgnify:CR=1 FL=1